MLWSLLFSMATNESSLSSGWPGWINIANTIPRKALNMDVRIKYSNVLTAILPLILAFKLAEPAMRLAMMRGRIMSFNNLIKSSPGYDIIIKASGPRLYGRRPNPESLLWNRKYKMFKIVYLYLHVSTVSLFVTVRNIFRQRLT